MRLRGVKTNTRRISYELW